MAWVALYLYFGGYVMTMGILAEDKEVPNLTDFFVCALWPLIVPLGLIRGVRVVWKAWKKLKEKP